MSIYVWLEKALLSLISVFWKLFILIHEYKNIFSKRKIFKQVQLTPTQKKQIDAFYLENYGKKIPYWWHRLYQSYTGKFDHQYIPEIIFSTRIEPETNDRIKVFQFENKNMISVLFGHVDGIHLPRTFLFRCEGCFYDKDRCAISEKAAIAMLNAQSEEPLEAVIKKAVDSSSGRGVRFLRLHRGVDLASGEALEQIFERMGSDFVIQEKIVQHPAIEKIYPHAINTLRVITYRVGGEYHVAPIVLRIGRGGGNVDNAHAGGIFIGVKDDGTLMDEAYTEYQLRFKEHPDTRLVFDGYQLPAIDKVKEMAKKLHGQIPTTGYVSWDFSVNPDEDIVLIEANMNSQSVWISQMAHGESFFKENTARILQEYGFKKH